MVWNIPLVKSGRLFLTELWFVLPPHKELLGHSRLHTILRTVKWFSIYSHILINL